MSPEKHKRFKPNVTTEKYPNDKVSQQERSPLKHSARYQRSEKKSAARADGKKAALEKVYTKGKFVNSGSSASDSSSSEEEESKQPLKNKKQKRDTSKESYESL